MDRSVLDSDHRLLGGLLIAAYAASASSEGFIHVRAEYPLAIKRLRTAIRQAERLGLLGASICGHAVWFPGRLAVGRWRFCLRRGDCAHRVRRGEAGNAPSAFAVSRAGRPLRRAHADQQRGDFRQHCAHNP